MSRASRTGPPAVAGAEVVEAAPRVGELQQLDVAASEDGGAEGGDDRHLIGGAVDGAQAVQDFPHVLRGQHQRLTLYAVGDAGVFEGVLDGPEVGARRNQDAHVPEPRRTEDAAAFVGLLVPHPPRPFNLRDQAGQRRRFRLSCRLGVTDGVPDAVDAQRRVGLRRRPPRVEVFVGRLRLACHVPREDVVGPPDHRLLRAEVLSQRDAVRSKALPDFVQRGDVGAPEPVDGLLGVADHEEFSGDDRCARPIGGLPVGGVVVRVAGEEEGNLRLDGIGVLELVDEDVGEAALEVAAAVGGVPEEVARPDEQVVELGPPLASSSLRVVDDETPYLLREGEQRCRSRRAQLLRAHVLQSTEKRLEGLATVDAIGAVLPVALPAPCEREPPEAGEPRPRRARVALAREPVG